MIKYTDYINATLPERQANLAAMLESIRDQQAKNYSAPMVSGSQGGAPNANIGGGSVPMQQQFKVVGGKVIPVAGRQSQGWGKSRIRYAAGRHTGVDFGVGVGTNVRAAANGIVVFSGSGGAYGNMIKVRHPDGYTTLYAHLSRSGVKVGQRVKAGASIGRSGNTGRSTGAHLHFEVRSRDRYGGDVNPYSWYSR